MKHILKTLLKLTHRFCLMMDFPDKLIILVNWRTSRMLKHTPCSIVPFFVSGFFTLFFGTFWNGENSTTAVYSLPGKK